MWNYVKFLHKSFRNISQQSENVDCTRANNFLSKQARVVLKKSLELEDETNEILNSLNIFHTKFFENNCCWRTVLGMFAKLFMEFIRHFCEN
jgi:hypothetical protein